MKISVNEALKLAKEKLPANINVELAFFDDDEMHLRIVYAIAKEAGLAKAAIWLTLFGMVRNFDDGKKIVEKAFKLFDKRTKV